jgi:hypothetical protein
MSVFSTVARIICGIMFDGSGANSFGASLCRANAAVWEVTAVEIHTHIDLKFIAEE